MSSDLSPAGTDRLRSLVWRVLVAPATVRLRTQVLIGAAVYLAILVVLVATGLSGTSSGVMYSQFFSGADPHRLAGEARAIRSDEYFVATPLLISQIQQGLPRITQVYPGGGDLSILWDVPYRDWSTLLRPQNLGFFVMPLDNAFALKWWLPLIALGAVTYFLLVTLWKRPIAAFAISGAFVVSPFFQWWYGAGSYWPPTFGIVLLLVTIWMLRVERAWARWVLGAVAGYVALVAIVALYPAFLIPCVLAGAAGAVGWLVSGAPDLPWRTRLRRIAPVFGAAAVAVGVLGAYLLTRRDALEAITSTVYPGQRAWPTGASESFFPASMYAGVFAKGLGAGDLGRFAPNPSEGSSFLFVGIYLVPAALWLIWDRWHRTRRIDGVLAWPLGILVVFFAFIYVPGWDAVARLLMLQMTTTPRIVIGLGLLSFMLLALVVHRLLEQPVRPPLWVPLACLALVVANHGLVAWFLRTDAPAVLAYVRGWRLLVAALVVATAAFAVRRVTLASVLVAVVALVVGGTVNPVYRGLLDLRTTDIGQAVLATESQDPGNWIGTGSVASVAMLRETAVPSFSGTQGWPNEKMWELIDPTGAHENSWNRYAHVLWTTDLTAPDFAVPAGDTVVIKLDSCSAFVQANVEHIVTQEPLEQSCVRLRESVPEETSVFMIYDVVPAAS